MSRALTGVAGLDYHTAALQRYRLERELARARERGAMVAGDRRDSTIMSHAEWDRMGECGLKPAERCMMALAALATYDRYREAKKLRLASDRSEAGRVWP